MSKSILDGLFSTLAPKFEDKAELISQFYLAKKAELFKAHEKEKEDMARKASELLYHEKHDDFSNMLSEVTAMNERHLKELSDLEALISFSSKLKSPNDYF